VTSAVPDFESEPGEASPASDVSVEAIAARVVRPTSPPLRIHHIMTITAVAAALLSVGQQIRHSKRMGLEELFASSWGAMYAISTAISVTLVMFGFAWRRRGYAFFSLPGHWLLLMQAAGISFILALAIAVFAGNGLAAAPLVVYSLGIQLVLFGLNLFAAWKISDSLGWRMYFLTQSFMFVLGFLFRFLLFRYESLYFVFYAPLLLLLIAAIGDRVKRRARDWPHWVGVALPFAVFIASIIHIFQR
jgi:hypothetical protein